MFSQEILLGHEVFFCRVLWRHIFVCRTETKPDQWFLFRLGRKEEVKNSPRFSNMVFLCFFIEVSLPLISIQIGNISPCRRQQYVKALQSFSSSCTYMTLVRIAPKKVDLDWWNPTIRTSWQVRQNEKKSILTNQNGQNDICDTQWHLNQYCYSQCAYNLFIFDNQHLAKCSMYTNIAPAKTTSKHCSHNISEVTNTIEIIWSNHLLSYRHSNWP